MHSIATAKVSKQGGSALMRYFTKFEPLAEYYARQLFDEHRIGFEFQDLVQEFKVKIYTSIIGYAKYVEKRKATQYKPWPIQLYVKCALVNKKKDFIKQISETPAKLLSIEANAFDYSLHHTMESHIIMSPTVMKCEINGVDLLQGLTLTEARCFMLFLRGYTVTKLGKIFKKSLPYAPMMIQQQCNKLQQYRSVLLEDTFVKFYSINTETEN